MPNESTMQRVKLQSWRFAQELAAEVGSFGITATSVCPDVFETEMTRTMGKGSISDQVHVEKWARLTALRR